MSKMVPFTLTLSQDLYDVIKQEAFDRSEWNKACPMADVVRDALEQTFANKLRVERAINAESTTEEGA